MQITMSDNRFNFEYGVTREQACIMCHLSSECDGCCLKCKAEGKNGSCYGQSCSQPGRDHMGQRWETWIYIVATMLPRLRRFVPRKYWKYLKRIRQNERDKIQVGNKRHDDRR